MKHLYVRRISDDEVVSRIEVRDEHRYERVMRGMLINMNTDEFYIDDSDFDTEQQDAASTEEG